MARATSLKRLQRTVGALTYAALGVAILVLLAVLYVVISAVFGATDAPRTIVESQIANYEAKLDANPSDVESWEAYARVLVYAGDYAAAERALEDAKDNLAEGKSPARFMIVEAEMLIAQEKYEEALALTDALLEEYPKVKAEAEEEWIAKGVTESAFEELGPGEPLLLEAHVLRARIFAATEDWSSVVDETTKALDVSATAADVITLRGDAYAELGEVDMARADYERAAEFDYEPAIEALEELSE